MFMNKPATSFIQKYGPFIFSTSALAGLGWGIGTIGSEHALQAAQQRYSDIDAMIHIFKGFALGAPDGIFRGLQIGGVVLGVSAAAAFVGKSVKALSNEPVNNRSM